MGRDTYTLDVKQMNKLLQGFRNFKNGIVILSGKSEGEGDRRLAAQALIIQETTTSHNKHEVRRRLIKSIEDDFKRAAKKGGEAAIDAMIDNAYATPECVGLYTRLNLEKAHFIVMKKTVLKEMVKKDKVKT